VTKSVIITETLTFPKGLFLFTHPVYVLVRNFKHMRLPHFTRDYTGCKSHETCCGDLLTVSDAVYQSERYCLDFGLSSNVQYTLSSPTRQNCRVLSRRTVWTTHKTLPHQFLQSWYWLCVLQAVPIKRLTKVSKLLSFKINNFGGITKLTLLRKCTKIVENMSLFSVLVPLVEL